MSLEYTNKEYFESLKKSARSSNIKKLQKLELELNEILLEDLTDRKTNVNVRKLRDEVAFKINRIHQGFA